MANNYKLNEQSTEGMIAKIKQNVADYTAKVGELTILVREIKESNSWIDDQLKPDFINTCEAFIKLYYDTISSLSKNIEYMEKKTNTVSSLNQSYKGA